MRRLHGLLLVVALAASGLDARSEERGSALQALQSLQTRVGPEVCDVLVAMHGEQGQDQPVQWVILTLNAQSPNLGQQFAVSEKGVVDEGVPPGLYPEEIPPGFFARADLLVDSPYAFQALNQAASRARVQFNSVDYTLVAREYGREPVWRLEALDTKGRVVGQVDLSGKSGTIFRSIWYYWDSVETGSAWQGPRIVDSLLSEAAVQSPEQPSQPGNGAGAYPLAGTYPERAPAAEPVRTGTSDAKEKEKGGLFSRFRRPSRPLFGGSSPSSPAPAPVAVPVIPAQPAPEAGVAVPLPSDPSAPTVEVAPAGGAMLEPAPAPAVPDPVRRADTMLLPPNR